MAVVEEVLRPEVKVGIPQFKNTPFYLSNVVFFIYKSESTHYAAKMSLLLFY